MNQELRLRMLFSQLFYALGRNPRMNTAVAWPQMNFAPCLLSDKIAKVLIRHEKNFLIGRDCFYDPHRIRRGAAIVAFRFDFRRRIDVGDNDSPWMLRFPFPKRG